MKYLSLLKRVVSAMVLSGLATSALAQWELDDKSSAVGFITTKNATVAESHSFTSLTGYISKEGKLQVEISLDSVETLIPIRNERMRQMLFETVDFPMAKVTAEVDDSVMKAVSDGDVLVAEVPITLSLHGREKLLSVPVVLIGTADGSILAVASSPILVNAADFGLEKGVALLREAAGLKSISTAVPVSFQLYFVPAS
jgi:polyisoprenoid-binding protein YceI